MESKFVTTRIPVNVYEAIKAQAIAQNRSVSSQIVFILRQATKE